MVAPAAGLNPRHYLETIFNVSVSGRVITPVLYSGLEINGIVYVGDSGAFTTLTGSSEGASYDLAAFVSGPGTFGLTYFALGTCPLDAPGIRLIGTVVDFPNETRCQVLLNAGLAFTSDQYVSVASDGLHVKAFAGTTINFGQIILESPTRINDMKFHTTDTSAFIETPPNQPTDITITAGRNIGLTGGGNLGGGITYIQTLTAISGSSWVSCGVGLLLSAGAVGNPVDSGHSGAIDITARGASIWQVTTGSLTVENTGTGTLVLQTNSGTLALSSTSGTITITPGNGTVSVTGNVEVTGNVVSKGSLAGLVAVDRAGTNNVQLFRDATNFYFNTTEGGNVWSVNLTSGNIAQETWTTIPGFVNGWGSFSGRTAQYRKTIHNRVEFRGAFAGGTATANTVIATMPSGRRPVVSNKTFIVESNGAMGSVRFDTDGSIRIFAGGNTILSLEGLSYDMDS